MHATRMHLNKNEQEKQNSRMENTLLFVVCGRFIQIPVEGKPDSINSHYKYNDKDLKISHCMYVCVAETEFDYILFKLKQKEKPV